MNAHASFPFRGRSPDRLHRPGLRHYARGPATVSGRCPAARHDGIEPAAGSGARPGSRLSDAGTGRDGVRTRIGITGDRHGAGADGHALP